MVAGNGVQEQMVMDMGRLMENIYHRIGLSYTLNIGRIPKGLHVLHSCNNPPCCNPKHLRTGTCFDNIQDKVLAGNSGKGIPCSEETKKNISKAKKGKKIQPHSEDHRKNLSIAHKKQ